MSTRFLRRSTRLLSALVFSALAFLTPAARAVEVPLLDELEQAVRVDGGFMKHLSEKHITSMRKTLAAGEAPEPWEYASEISTLQLESRQDLPSDPARALRKITLLLKLADAWRDRLDNWGSFVQRDEASALMQRWFLRGDDADRQLAHRLFAENDRTATEAKNRGMGAYFLGAEYEGLAGLARSAEHPRAEQVALLRAGIAANRAGHTLYPDGFNSTTGLNALYGRFQFVSGGSMLPEVIDEWLATVQALSPESQGISGDSLANALFQLHRDDAAVAWLTRYLAYWETTSVPPDAVTLLREGRCRALTTDSGLQAFEHRAPERAAALRQRACAGVVLDQALDVQQAVDWITGKD